MKFRQLFDKESSTYSYLLWDGSTLEAVIIDPVMEQSQRDIKVIHELGLTLLYTLETHIHADHITGGGLLRDKLGCQVGVHENGQVSCADLWLKQGDNISFGEYELRVLHTPGHTNTDICYHTEDWVFTGDTLLIRGSGRTDFQSGDAGQAFDSIQDQLFTLPDDYRVFPAHDYVGLTESTIGEEKQFNPRLGKNQTREGYIRLMNGLVLEKPKKIVTAVPANQHCGDSDEMILNQLGSSEE